MTLRPANIGIPVTVAIFAIGLVLVGSNPSDSEAQGVFGVALLGGWVTMMILIRRQLRRLRR